MLYRIIRYRRENIQETHPAWRLELVFLLLRLALAFSFLYAAVGTYFNPDAWIGFFPSSLIELIGNDVLLLSLWGLVEVVVALWLLSGKNIFIPSLAATGMLLGVALFNTGAMDIVFRDLSLATAALALAVWSIPKNVRE